ncbi:MAG TPA: type II secretion system F family protein, partial [Candidatus Norongarragalinales archaeon]|nr:type II secretion system F family protein [Candidatus Norongarragalinales archaeon]
VRRINAGTSELDALSEASQQNPSLGFQRALWQLTNALKVGSDVSRVVESLVDEFIGEQKDQIRRYGQELSPWAMLYMMLAVVVPSLGVTMMLVVASFAKFSIPLIFLGGVIAFLVFFQLFFMNFISTRRPSV